ncbi:MAG: DMT family transporter [Rhodospirillaceae bacterium]|nr:DMT family transporter [Rhodospirillaceae bacterium]MDD9913480.1 DMT family transporter [Rhodospirillaceae bacterium]MDD9925881.1 DMT family transporter [Rhodospirillaceae bacterium]
MTYFALALVLSAALCHATWNLLVKKIDGGPELVWLFSAISVLLYLPVAIAVYVIEQPVLGSKEIVFCIVSALLHMAYFLLLQQGYRKGDLSLVYPTARATGPFLSTIFAVVILGEHLTMPIVVGGLAVVVGVVFLTGGFRKTAGHMKTSLAFGLGAGLLIGSYTAWDAYTVSILVVPPLLLDYTSSLTRAALLAPYALRRREAVRRQWREHKAAILGIAVFNPLAYILVLTALAFTPVVYVAPAREVSVLITVAMGSLLLGEGQLRQRMGWAILIVLGMVLLSLG